MALKCTKNNAINLLIQKENSRERQIQVLILLRILPKGHTMKCARNPSYCFPSQEHRPQQSDSETPSCSHLKPPSLGSDGKMLWSPYLCFIFNLTWKPTFFLCCQWRSWVRKDQIQKWAWRWWTVTCQDAPLYLRVNLMTITVLLRKYFFSQNPSLIKTVT